MTTEPASSYIVFGEITHPIPPGPLNRARMLHNPKANSYSQPHPPVNTKAAQKHAGSDKPSSPKLPLNTKPTPISIDTRTAVSNWLATSQTFEKPPRPLEESLEAETIPDPGLARRKRFCKEYWLQVSKDLDLRLKAQPKVPTRVDEHTPLRQIDALCDSVCQWLPSEEGRRGKCSMVIHFSELREKIQAHHRTQEQLDSEDLHKADEAVKAMAAATQLEVAKSTSPNEAAGAQEKEKEKEKEKEQQPGPQQQQGATEAIKTKAKKLAADAMAKYNRERERKEYIEARAREIHENMCLCKPFDVDAVRREFADEEEVRDVKRRVWELGYGGKM